MNRPFRFDQVGSLLRTPILKAANKALADNKMSVDEYHALKQSEIKKIVKRQRDVGLKSITDGEFNREYWHYDFISYLNGIHTYVAGDEGKFHGSMNRLKSYYVEGEVSFPQDHPFLDDYKFLHGLCESDEVAKITIPGPNMVYFSGVVNNEVYKEKSTYTDLTKIKQEIAKVYQDAIQAFYKNGCRYLQFDDTSWGALFSATNRKALEDKGINTSELVKEFAEITIESLKDRPLDMTITTHCCRGNFKSNWLYDGDYNFVKDDIFRAPFDGWFLEFDDDRSGSLEIIQEAKHGRIVLGLLTTKRGGLEDKEVIKKRIQEATKYLPLDRLCLSCQCGFSSTEDGNSLSEEEQFTKLRTVKEIVCEVWEDA